MGAKFWIGMTGIVLLILASITVVVVSVRLLAHVLG